MFLQSYVLPVCVYREEGDGTASVVHLHGTSFFINELGAFLTAAHVAIAAKEEAIRSGLGFGLVCKEDEGRSARSAIAPVLSFEVAPFGRDIAVGTTRYRGPTLFALCEQEVEVWQDVAAYGYPQEAVSGPVEGLKLNLRAHKGYIQRKVGVGDIALSPMTSGFELDFVLARGLSGAPLFIHDEPNDRVIGICVGTVRSETIEDEIVEVRDDGSRYVEKRMSINQYGLAESLHDLTDWRPDGFGDRTLREIFALA